MEKPSVFSGREMETLETIDLEAPGPSNSRPSLEIREIEDKEDQEEATALTIALAEVAECRAKIAQLGERPLHHEVEQSRQSIAEIDSSLLRCVEELLVARPDPDISPSDWKAFQAEREEQLRNNAEAEKAKYKAILDLDELHEAYAVLLKKAEADLVMLSDPITCLSPRSDVHYEEEVNEAVVQVLQDAQKGNIEKVDLKGCNVVYVPEALCKILNLVTLDLSNNKLKALTDSIGGLHNLENLNLENNSLEALPDSIGLLDKLKVLNVSVNKLTTFPESILGCRCLITLEASVNELAYLPTNIGLELTHLEHLLVRMNKLRTLPISLCSLKALKRLDVSFNQLKLFPPAIGNLTNLEILDASSNFNDLESLPESFGSLASLATLNLSYNQLRVLPGSFWRLTNLKTLQLEENPLETPPDNVVKAGPGAVLAYMKQAWENKLAEQEQVAAGVSEREEASWLPKLIGESTSWLGKLYRSASGKMREHKSQQDYLEQQL